MLVVVVELFGVVEWRGKRAEARRSEGHDAPVAIGTRLWIERRRLLACPQSSRTQLQCVSAASSASLYNLQDEGRSAQTGDFRGTASAGPHLRC